MAIFGSVQMAMSRIINLHHHRIAQVGRGQMGTRKGLNLLAVCQDVEQSQELARDESSRMEGSGYLVGIKVLTEAGDKDDGGKRRQNCFSLG